MVFLNGSKIEGTADSRLLVERSSVQKMFINLKRARRLTAPILMVK
jgi:hypothetical protein